MGLKKFVSEIYFKQVKQQGSDIDYIVLQQI